MNSSRRLYSVLAVCLSMIVLTSSFLAAACARSTTSPQPVISGWVSANGPVSGTKLTIYDLKAKKIYESGESATSEIGFFQLAVKNLPQDFRITATGGNDNGKVLPSSLSADYRGFNPDKDTIRINLVTTIVSTYLDKHSGVTLDKAIAVVKNYLEIPETVNIGTGLDASETYFSRSKFITEAGKGGGVSQYITELVSGLNGNTTHPFHMDTVPVTGGANTLPGTGLGGTGGLAAGWFVDKIAGGAVTYTAGHLLGWGLSKAGINFGDETASAIKQMNDELKAISDQLVQLSLQIGQMEQELTEQIHKVDYDRIYNEPTLSLITSIIGKKDAKGNYQGGLYQNLQDFLKKTDWASDTARELRRQAIIEDIQTHLLPAGFDPKTTSTLVTQKQNLFNNQLYGLDYGTPILDLWSLRIQDHHRFVSSEDSYLILQHFSYWDTLQQWLTTLLVEYFHAKIAESEVKLAKLDKSTDEYEMELAREGAYKDAVTEVIANYNSNLEAQQDKIPAEIPEGVFVDTRTGKMWMRQPQLTNQYGQSWLEDTYKPNVEIYNSVIEYVYGTVDHFKKINPDAAINQTPSLGFGFNNWELPSTEDLRKLMEGSGSNATDWFISQGAFSPDATFNGLWGSPPVSTMGGVWTSDWYWKGSISQEVVIVKNIGMNGTEVEVSQDRAYSARDIMGYAAVFPVRQPDKTYYLKN